MTYRFSNTRLRQQESNPLRKFLADHDRHCEPAKQPTWNGGRTGLLPKEREASYRSDGSPPTMHGDAGDTCPLRRAMDLSSQTSRWIASQARNDNVGNHTTIKRPQHHRLRKNLHLLIVALSTLAFMADACAARVCVVGLGPTSLPLALVLADRGHTVVGYDRDPEKVAQINAGKSPIEETATEELLQSVLAQGTFTARADPQAADIFIFTTPITLTPEHHADTHALEESVRTLLPSIQRGALLIIAANAPVGTTRRLGRYIEEQTQLRMGTDFLLAFCPERAIAGSVLTELGRNPRLIGGIDESSCQAAHALYASFVTAPVHYATPEMAEMVKLIENSSRNCQIAFAIEVAQMAQAADLDPYTVIELANKHPRVNILSPSCGVGGTGMGIDPWFLIDAFPTESSFLRHARTINDHRSQDVVAQIQQTAQELAQRRGMRTKIALFGITYKPDVNDLNQSPALYIAERLVEAGVHEVLVADPHVTQEMVPTLPLTDVSTALANADVLVFLVGHSAFRTLDETIMNNKIVLDFCAVRHRPVVATSCYAT